MNTALVIYDLTGKILAVYFGETNVPQGIPYLFVDVPDGESVLRVDLTDPDNPVAVLSGENKTDLTKLREEMDRISIKVDENIPDEKEPETLAEWKEYKKKEVAKVCSETIYNGLDIKLSDGISKHFTLRESDKFHDQLNLIGAQVRLLAGEKTIEYHPDGEPCVYYSATDMQTIITAAMRFVSYHQTYCNSLNMWIAGCKDIDSVKAISYGNDIPEEYQSDVLKTKLAAQTE